MAKIEFYLGKAEFPFIGVEDGAVPKKGEYINIAKKTYKVEAVTWTVDQPTDVRPFLRANVTLRRSDV